MKLVYAWPDGTWAYDFEVYHPEPGYVTFTVNDLATDADVEEQVYDELEKRSEGSQDSEVLHQLPARPQP